MSMTTTTVCVVGFPVDAMHRELKNLCRFAPGFECAHVVEDRAGSKSPMLFVKFQTKECAEFVIASIHGRPFDLDMPESRSFMRAEYARRELEIRDTQPPIYGGMGMGMGMGGGPRYRADGGGGGGGMQTAGAIETLAILGIRDKGLSQDELQGWMQSRPGYMTHKYNDKVDGVFIRFANPTQAEQALDAARKLNIGAEWARRNLDEDVSPAGAFDGGRRMMPEVDFAAKRARKGGEPNDEIVTLAVLGVNEKGVAVDELSTFFQSLPGFVTVQVNTRIGGVFAKFDSRRNAENGLKEANAMNYGTEFARRNLDV